VSGRNIWFRKWEGDDDDDDDGNEVERRSQTLQSR
jgi:hypothetical protein